MADRRDLHVITGAVGVSSLGDFLLWIPLTLHLREQTDSGLAIAALVGVGVWRLRRADLIASSPLPSPSAA